MSNINGKILVNLLISFVIIFLAVSCTSPPDDPTPTEESVAAPGGLGLADDPDGGSGDDGEDEYLGDDEGDIERPPAVAEGEDGYYWVIITLPEARTDGVYLGVFETEDENGSSMRGGATNCEVLDDQQISCPAPTVAETTSLEFQVIFIEAFSPLLPSGDDGIHFPDPIVLELDKYALPLDLISEGTLSKIDRNMVLYRMCLEGETSGNSIGVLEDFCSSLLASYDQDPFSWLPDEFWNDPMGYMEDAIEEAYDEATEDVHCWQEEWKGTVFCDGMAALYEKCTEEEWKDTYFCSGKATLDEAAALTAGFAQACSNELGISFEDPLTAFEDPLTAFEDPLTAFVSRDHDGEFTIKGLVGDPQETREDYSSFEDPLTAFEDPLTAFEDPLTAFEDPLTAHDIGRLTMIYTGIRPFIGNWESYPACNVLANVANNYQYSLKGETLLSQLMKEYPAPLEVTRPQTISVPPVMDNPSHCDIFNSVQVLEPYYYITQGDNHVTLHFPFPDLVPGLSLDVPGVSVPYIYSATLGGVPSDSCVLNGPDQISCLITRLGRNNEILYDVPAALHVMGCSEPVYSGALTLPGINYSRCDFFETIDMRLYVADPSTDLKVYVTMENGVPGLEIQDYAGFDQMPVIYWSDFDGITARSYFLSDFPGRLYTDFSIPASYLNSYKLLQLFVNNCDSPILSKTIILQSGGSGGGSSDGGEVICDPNASTQAACEAGGGTWKTYLNKAPECICP